MIKMKIMFTDSSQLPVQNKFIDVNTIGEAEQLMVKLLSDFEKQNIVNINYEYMDTSEVFEDLAKTNVIVHHCFTAYKMGNVSYTQALEQMVVGLAEVNEAFRVELTKLLQVKGPLQ